MLKKLYDSMKNLLVQAVKILERKYTKSDLI